MPRILASILITILFSHSYNAETNEYKGTKLIKVFLVNNNIAYCVLWKLVRICLEWFSANGLLQKLLTYDFVSKLYCEQQKQNE